MESYFTFFLCSLEWTEADRVLQFVDWLAETLPLQEKLHLIVRQKESAIKRKPTAAGDFSKFRHLLRELPLESFSLSNRQWPSETTELFVTFENAHYTYTYSGSEPQQTEVPKAIKIFSFSVRKGIWEGCEKTGASLKVLANVEALFGAINCIYGYGDARVPLITGSPSLIGNRELTQKIRIVDFDYTRYIEKIYRYNYLSSGLLERTGVPVRLRESSSRFQYKDLYDSSGNLRGGAIYLKDLSPPTVQEVTKLLSAVIWSTS